MTTVSAFLAPHTNKHTGRKKERLLEPQEKAFRDRLGLPMTTLHLVWGRVPVNGIAAPSLGGDGRLGCAAMSATAAILLAVTTGEMMELATQSTRYNLSLVGARGFLATRKDYAN